MGFLSRLFGGGGGEEEQATTPVRKVSPQLLRLVKKVENKYGQAQDRQAALRALADLGTPDAVQGILKRFTFRIEQTIGDEEEKRLAHDLLVGLGDVAVEPILEFLRREDAPFWPTRILRTLVGEERTVTELLGIIEGMEAIFDRDIERKVELVSNLREFRDPRVRDALLSFADDDNEELRVHAIEGLAEMGSEEMGDVLLERYLNEDETQRVRTAILNLLIDRKWKVRHRKDEVRKVLPPTFWIDDVGVIHRR